MSKTPPNMPETVPVNTPYITGCYGQQLVTMDT